LTIVYFDSSAFVKLLVEEDGSDLAAALWDGCDAVVASRLGYPEVCAALAAAGRSLRLDPNDQRQAEAAWNDYWSAVRAVELTDAIATSAGRLAAGYGLRGGDAVHLASVLAVGVQHTVLAAWDERLRAGAEAAGVRVAPRD
jgi:uncharacterized protein